jgi:hypothetical protein
MAQTAERMKAMRERRRARGLRELRLVVPDTRSKAVRKRVAKQVAGLDRSLELAAGDADCHLQHSPNTAPVSRAAAPGPVVSWAWNRAQVTRKTLRKSVVGVKRFALSLRLFGYVLSREKRSHEQTLPRPHQVVLAVS